MPIRLPAVESIETGDLAPGWVHPSRGDAIEYTGFVGSSSRYGFKRPSEPFLYRPARKIARPLVSAAGRVAGQLGNVSDLLKKARRTDDVLTGPAIGENLAVGVTRIDRPSSPAYVRPGVYAWVNPVVTGESTKTTPQPINALPLLALTGFANVPQTVEVEAMNLRGDTFQETYEGPEAHRVWLMTKLLGGASVPSLVQAAKRPVLWVHVEHRQAFAANQAAALKGQWPIACPPAQIEALRESPTGAGTFPVRTR